MTTGSSPPPAARISRITSLSDFYALAAIEDAAYGAASPMMNLMFGTPTGPPDSASHSQDCEQSLVARAERHIHVWNTDPTARYFKATSTETDDILGIAIWHRYTGTETAQERHPWRSVEELADGGGNASLRRHYFARLTQVREEHFGVVLPCWFLANLAANPREQGRGIGGRLLEEVLAMADEERVVSWCDASPSGVKLYKNKGWREIGSLEFDLERWGGRGTHVVKSMVRSPKGDMHSYP